MKGYYEKKKFRKFLLDVSSIIQPEFEERYPPLFFMNEINNEIIKSNLQPLKPNDSDKKIAEKLEDLQKNHKDTVSIFSFSEFVAFYLESWFYYIDNLESEFENLIKAFKDSERLGH